MKKKLFVSNLDFGVTEDQLREAFEQVGGAASVVLAVDRETKKSKGFAFVEMSSEDSATKAIETLNGSQINGRPIRVTQDRGKGGATGGPSERPSSAGGESGAPGAKRSFEILPPIQRMSLFKRKRKLDPFMEDPSKSVDYRDISTLKRFTSERGKILSRRLTGLDAYNQRKVKKAIKRAQNLGLLPFGSN